MKKEIQCIKTSRNMATKTVPKNLQTIVSSLIDFVVNIADDNEDLREAMLSSCVFNISALFSISVYCLSTSCSAKVSFYSTVVISICFKLLVFFKSLAYPSISSNLAVFSFSCESLSAMIVSFSSKSVCFSDMIKILSAISFF